MDHELFANFFSSTFIDRDSDEKREFIIHGDQNDYLKFCTFIEEECSFLVGYNSSKYDDLITNWLLANKLKFQNYTVIELTTAIYDFGQSIINSQKGGKSIYWNNDLKPYFWTKLYKTIDLMSLMAFDKNRVSLKQAGIAMRWHKIQDLPKKFDEYIHADEVKLIMDYNVNDVLMTKRLLEIVISEVKIRKMVGVMYGVNIWSKSRSGVADKLMIKFWEQSSNENYREFKALRTEYRNINLSECISDKIQFKQNNLQELLKSIKSTVLTKGDKFKHSVVIGESKYDVLLGGLHSSNPPMIVEESNDEMIIDADFGSFYPNLMINLSIYPKHLSSKFLSLFKTIVKQRLTAKAKGEKGVADALKIVINSVYGKLNFEYGWLYDSKASYTVTLNGQMYLLMLIEQLEEAGITVFYANTDGITCKLPRNKEKLFYKICNDFQDYVDIPLEYANYKKCVIRDVNNFSIQTTDGKVKEKGVFVRDKDVVSTFLTPNYTCSYDMPVIAKALYEYFVNNRPIKESITSNNDIYDFCKAQKIGGQFTAEFHELSNDKLSITTCQKTNRYYVSNTQGKFYKKRNDNGSLHDLCAGYNVEIFNDHIKKDNYKINYRYYISVAQKIIDVLEPKQLKLF